MSWKCEKCNQKLKGKEKYCPECAEKIVYKCKSCNKVMDNGKHKYCPICSTQKAEKRVAMRKKTVVTVFAVGAIAVQTITKGKVSGGKS